MDAIPLEVWTAFLAIAAGGLALLAGYLINYIIKLRCCKYGTIALMNGETPHEVTNGHDLNSRGANSDRYEHESGRSGGAKTSALVFPQPRDRSDHRWSDTKLRARRLSRLDGDPLAQASDRCICLEPFGVRFKAVLLVNGLNR